MKIRFDGTQKMLGEILAAMEAGTTIEPSCPECDRPLHRVTGNARLGEPKRGVQCGGCGSIWEVSDSARPKAAIVWERFEEWEKGKR